jgi:hypothetical protein
MYQHRRVGKAQRAHHPNHSRVMVGTARRAPLPTLRIWIASLRSQ